METKDKLLYSAGLLGLGAPLAAMFITLFAIFTKTWQEPLALVITLTILIFLVVIGAIVTAYFLLEKEQWAFYASLGLGVVLILSLFGAPMGGGLIYFLLDKDLQKEF